MHEERDFTIDRGLMIARRLWREARESAKAGEGGPDHPALARALAQAGVPVGRLKDQRIPGELQWHPNALVDEFYGDVEVSNTLQAYMPVDQVLDFMDQLRHTASPELTHEGKMFRLHMTSESTRLEVRQPALIARIRSPAPRQERESPCQGLAVIPAREDGTLIGEQAMRIWGHRAGGRGCWLSHRFHRGILVVTPELLDAIAILAASDLATWWLPRPPGVDADPVPHELYTTRQITRVIVAYPVRQRPQFKEDGLSWHILMQQAQPTLKVDFVSPGPLHFPALVKDAPKETAEDREVRYVPADSVKGDVTWLKAIQVGGLDAARKAIYEPIQIAPLHDVVVETPMDTRPQLRGGPIEWARRFLYDRFLQDGDRRWRLAKVMGAWWVMTDRGWEQRTDEQMRHHAVAWMSTKAITDSHGLPEALRPKTEAINQFMLGLSIEATTTALQMPCWLHDTVEYKGDSETGLPRWAANADVLVPAKDPNAGRPAPEWLLSAENGTLDMGALREGRVEIRPLDPCYFGGPSLPYSVDVDMLQRMIAAVPRADYGSEEWLIGQDQLVELCREVAPVYTQSLCEQLGDFGVEHLADRLACLRAMLGDAISWIRVWEKVPYFFGKIRAGKDMTQYAIQAANGLHSIAIINNFDELNDQFAYAPLVGKKIAIIPDAHFDHKTDRQAPTKIKQISGRGFVRVRDLYAPAIPNARLSMRLMIMSNDPPNMRDPSMALPKRFALFPFTSTFVDREDDGRKDKVMREGPGIGLISLVGFFEAWIRKPKPGIFAPRIASELGYVERVLHTAAPLAGFVKRFCHVGDEYGPFTMETLYAAYRGAVAQGKIDASSPVGINRFGNELAHHCFLKPAGMEGHERLYTGMELNDAGHQLVQDGQDSIANVPPSPRRPFTFTSRGLFTPPDRSSDSVGSADTGFGDLPV